MAVWCSFSTIWFYSLERLRVALCQVLLAKIIISEQQLYKEMLFPENEQIWLMCFLIGWIPGGFVAELMAHECCCSTFSELNDLNSSDRPVRIGARAGFRTTTGSNEDHSWTSLLDHTTATGWCATARVNRRSQKMSTAKKCQTTFDDFYSCCYF